jgi:hypothetical protein
MHKLVLPIKQALIVSVTMILTMLIIYGTLIISQNTSYLNSSVYITRDTTRDNALQTASPSVISRLDSIIGRIRSKVATYSTPTTANTFID